MIVPLDAWQKMMTQLGNLHEAGQQLADARERAAKAETESAFLRERIADLRSERDRLLEDRDREVVTPPQAEPPARARRIETLWDRAVREWHSRRRR
jgi:hypothetical protein